MTIKKRLVAAAAVAAGLLTLAAAPQASAKQATADGFVPVDSVLGLNTMAAGKAKRSAAADAPTPVVILNEWSQRCLDATAPKNGSAIQLYDCDAAPSEVVYLSENPEGYVRIQNAATGRYIEASKSTPGGGVNGTKVQLWDFVAGGKNQWWLPVQNAEGHWRLKNAWSGRYLDASKSTPGGGVNGTKVQLWNFVSAGKNQWWPAYSVESVSAKSLRAPRTSW